MNLLIFLLKDSAMTVWGHPLILYDIHWSCSWIQKHNFTSQSTALKINQKTWQSSIGQMKNEISVIFFRTNQQIVRCILIALVDASCNKDCSVVLSTLSPYWDATNDLYQVVLSTSSTHLSLLLRPAAESINLCNI